MSYASEQLEYKLPAFEVLPSEDMEQRGRGTCIVKVHSKRLAPIRIEVEVERQDCAKVEDRITSTINCRTESGGHAVWFSRLNRKRQDRIISVATDCVLVWIRPMMAAVCEQERDEMRDRFDLCIVSAHPPETPAAVRTSDVAVEITCKRTGYKQKVTLTMLFAHHSWSCARFPLFEWGDTAADLSEGQLGFLRSWCEEHVTKVLLNVFLARREAAQGKPA